MPHHVAALSVPSGWMTGAGCKEDGEGYNGVRGCAAYCALAARHSVSCLYLVDRQICPVSCIVARAPYGKRKIRRILKDGSIDTACAVHCTVWRVPAFLVRTSREGRGRSLDPSWYVRTYERTARHIRESNDPKRRSHFRPPQRREKIPTSEPKAAKGRKILSKAARAEEEKTFLSLRLKDV